MKRLVTLAVTVVLTAFLAAAVSAAPSSAPVKPKEQQGIMNAKKAMKSRLERDKKVRVTQKQGQARRQQIQRGK